MRADTFGYLQRSFPGIASEVDREEAFGSGHAAVVGALREAAKGVMTGTLGIARGKGRKYGVEYRLLPITDAAKYARSMPREFIAANGHDVTQAFIDYAKPLVGELPRCEVL